MRHANEQDDSSRTAGSESRANERAEAQTLTCVACGELIAERIDTRPEYCFVCAVHVACSCASEPE